jgi:predicted metalloprotease
MDRPRITHTGKHRHPTAGVIEGASRTDAGRGAGHNNGHLVYLIHLVCLVDLVDLVHLVSLVQPKNKTNQMNQTNKTVETTTATRTNAASQVASKIYHCLA